MRPQMSKYILIFSISIFIHFQGWANHILGGDATYDCILVDTVAGTATLRVEFKVFRDGRELDEGSATFFDANTFFGVYRKSNNRWVYETQSSPQNVISERIVPLNDLKCLRESQSLIMWEGIYSFNLTLPLIDDDYMITYQRCCRGQNITNIFQAEDEGSVFAIEITPEGLKSCNDPIEFDKSPPLVLCSGFPFEFDHSAVDSDGDSIVYRICNPISTGQGNRRTPRVCESCVNPDPSCDCSVVRPCPARCTPEEFREVTYKTGFSALEPIPGDPAVRVDPATGLLTVTPNATGEFTMGICAIEYRDGVELSRIRRDMQFVITICDKDLNAIVKSDKQTGNGVFEVVVCGDGEVNLISESTVERFIDIYDWRIDLDGQIARSNLKDPTFTLPGLGEYEAKLVLNPGEFVCTDSADILVRVFPDMMTDFEFEYDTCEAGIIEFDDRSTTNARDIVSWQWSFDDGAFSSRENPNHTYAEPGLKEITLISADNNGCTDSLTQMLFYTPIPDRLAVVPDVFLTCLPAVVTFDNISEPIDSTYMVEWDFGDGSTGPERFDLHPTHVYTEKGEYDISLTVTSPSGCVAKQDFDNFVEILDGFSLDFEFDPEQPTTLQNTVNFTGFSEIPGDYFWNFGDGETSLVQSPRHTYQDTGLFLVTMRVRDDQGCVDQVTKELYVSPLVTLIYPNAFTPDGDGLNDEFIGKGERSFIQNFQLSIFDRWGKIVFQTNEIAEGWNGRINNSGQLVPVGVYTYLSTYELPRLGKQEQRGVATLIR